MMVDVVRLRVGGVKLSPEAVKATPALRGDLRFTYYTRTGNVGGWEPGTTGRAAIKYSPGANGASVVPDLYEAFVKKVQGQSMLVVGYELIDGFTKAHARVQAWWCTIVTE